MWSRRGVQRVLAALLALGAAVAASGSAEAASYYQVTDLGTFNGSSCGFGSFGRSSFATALNDHAAVVGGSCVFLPTFHHVNHAFLWREGVLTDLGTLGIPPFPEQSAAHGINDAGQIVGRDYFDPFSRGTAFFWSGGTMTSLDGVLGGGFSSASDINNAGQIVGIRGVPPDIASWGAFLYDTVSGQVTTLPGLAATFRTAAAAINDAGDIAGYGTAALNVFHAVRWTAQVPTDLGTLGGTHSFANGINEAGDVVGSSWMPGDGGDHAFLYRGGVMRDLGTLGGRSSSAADINDSGVIVGWATTTSNDTHAFVYEDGVMTDLNDLISHAAGWTLVQATAINGAGQIVGTGRLGGGFPFSEMHAFLLTPAEPPPDLLPPVLSVPADFTLEASSAEGVLVVYAATATDDVDPRPTVACAPPSGSLFPIGTTTVECVATDRSGKTTTASFKVTVVPPFDMALALSRKSLVDPQTGVVTVVGTAACNRDASVTIHVSVTEAVAHRASIQGSAFTTVACVAPLSDWTVTVTGSNGPFGAGPVQADMFGFGCSFSCDSDQQSGSVILVGGPH